MSFVPRFTYSHELVRYLGAVEATRSVIEALPFVINSSDIASWFGVSENTTREWLKEWTTEGFVNPVLAGLGVRVRSYALADKWVEACFKIRQPSRGK